MIEKIPTERLPQTLWDKGKERARAYKKYTILEHQRLTVLAFITEDLEETLKISHTKAESKARLTRDYQEFLTTLGEAKMELELAKAKYAATDNEIKVRLNKSFEQSREYNSSKL